MTSGSASSRASAPTRRHDEFPAATLLDAKGRQTVSVCLPARNEAATVGAIVAAIRQDLLAPGVVDEIVVVDDHSSDATAEEARRAGARPAAACVETHGVPFGKLKPGSPGPGGIGPLPNSSDCGLSLTALTARLTWRAVRAASSAD